MQVSKHKIQVLVCFLAIGGFAYLLGKGLKLNAKQQISPIVGQSVKNSQVRMIQGTKELVGHSDSLVNLSDIKGTPLIINFWASWCSSCAEEAPVLEAFWKEHSSEIKVLGVAVHDSEESVRDAVRTLAKSYAIAFDEEGRASLNYGVTGVPETVFVNAEGIVIHKEVGQVNRPLLEKLLVKLKSGST